MKMETSGLLLDTHAWLWTLSGEKKLITKTVEMIDIAKENHLLFLSDISLWEISMLAKKERITLGQPTLIWLKHAIKESSLQLIHLTPEIVVESNELPGDFHGDPADRILVSTARILELTLITRDDNILKYGKTNRLHTLKI